VALGLFADAQADAARRAAEHQARIQQLADTLDRQSGAVTQATRQLLADQAAREGWLQTANRMGISSDLFVSALAGQKSALNQIQGAMAKGVEQLATTASSYDELQTTLSSAGLTLHDFALAAAGNVEAQDKLRAAGFNSAAAVKGVDGALA